MCSECACTHCVRSIGIRLYIGKFVFVQFRDVGAHSVCTDETALHTTRESGRCFKLTRIFETPLIPIHSIVHRSTVSVCTHRFFVLANSIFTLPRRICCDVEASTEMYGSFIEWNIAAMLGARRFYVFYQHGKVHSISFFVFIRR